MVSRLIKNASIRYKLTALVLIAVSLALAFACVAFAANHYLFASQAMVQQLDALAEVLGANATAALVFDDPEAATHVLSSLRMTPSIESAYVHDAKSALFCEYMSQDTVPSFGGPIKPGVETNGGRLTVCREIADEADEHVGYITLTASLAVVNDKLAGYAQIALVVMLVSLLAALLLAWPLQRSLAGPILALAEAAERVRENEDYTVRVDEPSEDEIGMLCRQFNRMLSRVEQGERELQQSYDLLEQRVEQRTAELSRVNQELNAEVLERQRAEKELADTHRELLEAARHAGMAEIATGVLHNVGNVLNSVNISASTIDERLRSPKRRQLDRVIELLEANRGQLGDYLTKDERGKNVPTLLAKLVDSLGSDDKDLIDEAKSLAENINHIKAIISTQQSFAGSGGLVEEVDVNGVLEDALRLNATSFTKHSVQVEREFADLPQSLIDKQRLMQIVVNLIKNAKEALSEKAGDDRVLTLRTRAQDGKLLVEVADNGIGIAPDGLAQIFHHGYTTKKGGHGFGLHSCANAAREMGGSLSASSDGNMRGATFSLSIPLKLKESANNTAGHKQTTSKG